MVLDTNVWVSAMVWGGSPAKIIKASEEGRILIMMSEEVIEEVSRILAYDRLRKIYEEAGVSRETLIGTMLRIGKLVGVETRLNLIREDSSDNKFLECAVDGDADYVVSGDEHLLKIGRYKGIRILSVTQFLKLLEG